MLVAVVDGDARPAPMRYAAIPRRAGFRDPRIFERPARPSSTRCRARPFDAVLTEWLFEGRSATPVIRSVRASDNPGAPIFVLTDALLSGQASEAEIGDAMRTFDVVCYEKPVRLSLMCADLAKRLSQH